VSRASDLATIKAAIDAKFAQPRAVEIDAAQKQTTDYVVVFLSRRYTDGQLMSGGARIDGWRVVTRYVCRTVANVNEFHDRTRAALEKQFLAGGVGPLSFEVEQEPLAYDTDDGGWYTAADAWLY